MRGGQRGRYGPKERAEERGQKVAERVEVGQGNGERWWMEAADAEEPL